MAQMRCEICGGNAITQIDEKTYECQNCGIQYSVQQAEKLLTDVLVESKSIEEPETLQKVSEVDMDASIIAPEGDMSESATSPAFGATAFSFDETETKIVEEASEKIAKPIERTDNEETETVADDINGNSDDRKELAFGRWDQNKKRVLFASVAVFAVLSLCLFLFLREGQGSTIIPSSILQTTTSVEHTSPSTTLSGSATEHITPSTTASSSVAKITSTETAISSKRNPSSNATQSSTQADQTAIEEYYLEFEYTDNHTVAVWGVRNPPASGRVTIPSTIDGYTVVEIGSRIEDEGGIPRHLWLGVTHLTLPDTVTKINPCAFMGEKDLKNIDIPNSVTHIGERAFNGSGIQTVVIPDSVVSIGSVAFQSSELKKVTFSGSIATIPENAFMYCKNLTSIVIPNSVIIIEPWAFAYSGLQEVHIPDSVKEIGENAFTETSLKSVDVPNATLGRGCFSQCKNLVEVNLSKSLVEIGPYAFAASSITEIEIPDSVVQIREGAFTGTSLTKVVIPVSVKVVEENAFGWCASLTDVFIASQDIDLDIFSFHNDHGADITLHAPRNVLEKLAYYDEDINKYYSQCDVDYFEEWHG